MADDDTLPSLDAIEGALFAQLEKLGPKGTKHFSYVGRYAGEITQAGVDTEALSGPTSALLAAEGGDPVAEYRQEVSAGLLGVAERVVWRVYVVVTDPREIDVSIKGAGGLPGALALTSLVAGVLNAFPIAGLEGHGQAEYLGWRPVPLPPPRTSHVTMVRFATTRVVEAYEITSAAVPLERIDGELFPPDDPATVLARLRAEF